MPDCSLVADCGCQYIPRKTSAMSQSYDSIMELGLGEEVRERHIDARTPHVEYVRLPITHIYIHTQFYLTRPIGI